MPGTGPESPEVGNLARDPVVLAALCVWGLAILPSILPILSPDATYTWADQFSDVPNLVFLVATLGWAIVRSQARGERLFWWLLQASTLSWLGVRGLFLIVPFEYWGIGMDLASDVLYLQGYLLLALGIEDRIRETVTHSDSRAEYFEAVGTLVFGFGLLAYFILAPSIFNPEIYETWVTSLLLYAVIDLYLVMRTLKWMRATASTSRRHRLAFWLLVTSLFWLISDLVEGMMYLGVFPWIDPGTPWDLLWHVPAFTILLAVRSYRPASTRIALDPESAPSV